MEQKVTEKEKSDLAAGTHKKMCTVFFGGEELILIAVCCTAPIQQCTPVLTPNYHCWIGKTCNDDMSIFDYGFCKLELVLYFSYIYYIYMYIFQY